MTITFENDNDVIIYALEKIISHARKTQQIFVAQCVWWLVSIIGLEPGLATYIDDIQSRIIVTVILEKVPREGRTVSPIPRDNQEDQRQDKILEECEEYLKDSKRLRDIATLKATGKTPSGFINPTAISKKHLRKKYQQKRKSADLPMESNLRTAGIDQEEIERRKVTGECLWCAWPSDRKGSHRVADCRRAIKLSKGTASFPKAKGHPELKQASQHNRLEEENSEPSSSEESADDSLSGIGSTAVDLSAK
jgi:hypothetical protein